MVLQEPATVLRYLEDKLKEPLTLRLNNGVEFFIMEGVAYYENTIHHRNGAGCLLCARMSGTCSLLSDVITFSGSQDKERGFVSSETDEFFFPFGPVEKRQFFCDKDQARRG